MTSARQDGLSVAFIGTPEFAATILAALTGSHHRVQRVITQPDRPRGRGMRMIPTPVAVVAERLGLPLTKLPPNAHGPLTALLAAERPDVIVTAAWAGMIRAAARAQARLAALNVHASLLPRWRGAAPIERAIMAGDELTGVTIIYMGDELDAGDMLIAREEPVPADVDGGWLRCQLAGLGAGLLIEALDLLSAGAAPRIGQPDQGVTIARKLTSLDERIDWKQPAPAIRNQIRALAPKPGAYLLHNGSRVIVTRAEVEHVIAASPAAEAQPGTVVGRDKDSLTVAAGGGTAVRLLQVKPAGGREMSGGAFANGRRLVTGQMLGEGGAQVVPMG